MKTLNTPWSLVATTTTIEMISDPLRHLWYIPYGRPAQNRFRFRTPFNAYFEIFHSQSIRKWSQPGLSDRISADWRNWSSSLDPNCNLARCMRGSTFNPGLRTGSNLWDRHSYEGNKKIKKIQMGKYKWSWFDKLLTGSVQFFQAPLTVVAGNFKLQWTVKPFTKRRGFIRCSGTIVWLIHECFTCNIVR